MWTLEFGIPRLTTRKFPSKFKATNRPFRGRVMEKLGGLAKWMHVKEREATQLPYQWMSGKWTIASSIGNTKFNISRWNYVSIRVICKVKGTKSLGLVQSLDLMRINTKSPQVFLMLKLPWMKSGVRLLKINFLACPTRMGRQSEPMIGQFGIQANKSHVHTLF